ncbi:ABC-2 family transporter protein [Caulifigura coniformis]|uniref:ABC-2 family transporter protein n=1 Tax=Caulifigura coniformis TaxID=2527983 RepID=A0A517SKA8_9PLAN|nr:ABC transporter permease subunit [Caulifigura coniformis]QDT56563.1 ABC-2 family transporter protein [Caulifigura coniformis]
MRQMRLVRTVIRKELRVTFRDRWLCLACALFSVALTVSCWLSVTYGAETVSEIESLQRTARQDWLDQPTTNAHMATHHGTTLYKPLSPLSVLDPGIDPLFGSQVRVQSHRQERMTDPRDARRPWLNSLAVDSPALLLEAGLPVFVVLLGFAGISREREQGTNRLLAGNGAPWSAVIVGKLAAICIIAAVMSLPALIPAIASLGLEAETPVMPWPDRGLRVLFLVTAGALYILGWAALSLAISSAAGSTRTAFLALILLWFGWTIAAPRLAGSVAMNRYPIPDWRDLERARDDALRFNKDATSTDDATGSESATPSESREISSEGAKLLALESFSDAVYDRFGGQIESAFESQDQVMSLGTLLSPYLAMRANSMLWSATDRRHHEDFRRAAETYRRDLVRSLNLMEARQERPGPSSEDRRVFWARMPAFDYRFPPAASVFRDAFLSTAVLCVWCLVTLVGAFRVPH